MITGLFILGFRGIEERHFDISRRTAIIGMNGSGKTHILESLHIVSSGNLHYFQAPKDESYSIELTLETLIGPKTYSLSRILGKEEYKIQGGKVSSIKYKEDLPFRTVFLSPFDMNLLYFAPSVRRDYIDSILVRAYAQFPKVKRDYDTILRQRNALLKKIREQHALPKDLDYWDRAFAEKAILYHTYRMHIVNYIKKHSTVFSKFLSKYVLQFSYQSKLNEGEDVEGTIIKYLTENRERDIITGHTHIGPHLDDFTIEVPYRTRVKEASFLDAAMVLSRGETKVLLLALKQIEILFLKEHLQKPIALLFDDIFAELDQNYAEQVIDIFDVDQVIFTTQRLLPVSEKWKDFSCIKLELQ